MNRQEAKAAAEKLQAEVDELRSRMEFFRVQRERLIAGADAGEVLLAICSYYEDMLRDSIPRMEQHVRIFREATSG